MVGKACGIPSGVQRRKPAGNDSELQVYFVQRAGFFMQISNTPIHRLTCKHTHTHMHTHYTYTCIHTYTYTHILKKNKTTESPIS